MGYRLALLGVGDQVDEARRSQSQGGVGQVLLDHEDRFEFAGFHAVHSGPVHR
jgi:hypothetical protein